MYYRSAVVVVKTIEGRVVISSPADWTMNDLVVDSHSLPYHKVFSSVVDVLPSVLSLSHVCLSEHAAAYLMFWHYLWYLPHCVPKRQNLRYFRCPIWKSNVDKKANLHEKMKHANSILEYFEYFCQISLKSILIILSYSISKLVHFLGRGVVWRKCTFQWYFCCCYCCCGLVIIIVIAMCQKLPSLLFDAVGLTNWKASQSTELCACVKVLWMLCSFGGCIQSSCCCILLEISS